MSQRTHHKPQQENNVTGNDVTTAHNFLTGHNRTQRHNRGKRHNRTPLFRPPNTSLIQIPPFLDHFTTRNYTTKNKDKTFFRKMLTKKERGRKWRMRGETQGEEKEAGKLERENDGCR